MGHKFANFRASFEHDVPLNCCSMTNLRRCDVTVLSVFGVSFAFSYPYYTHYASINLHKIETDNMWWMYMNIFRHFKPVYELLKMMECPFNKCSYKGWNEVQNTLTFHCIDFLPKLFWDHPKDHAMYRCSIGLNVVYLPFFHSVENSKGAK